jgi:hypothetical protein
MSPGGLASRPGLGHKAFHVLRRRGRWKGAQSAPYPSGKWGIVAHMQSLYETRTIRSERNDIKGQTTSPLRLFSLSRADSARTHRCEETLTATRWFPLSNLLPDRPFQGQAGDGRGRRRAATRRGVYKRRIIYTRSDRTTETFTPEALFRCRRFSEFLVARSCGGRIPPLG